MKKAFHPLERLAVRGKAPVIAREADVALDLPSDRTLLCLFPTDALLD